MVPPVWGGGRRNLLGGPTAWFKTWRSGCLKNIALIVVYLAWCGWPFVAAYFVDEVWCWIIAAVISLFLVWQGYLVVEQNWQVGAAATCTLPTSWWPCEMCASSAAADA